MSQRIRSDLLKQPKIPIGFLNDLNRCTSREEVFAAYAAWSSRIISADRTTIAIDDEQDGTLGLMAIDGNKAIATGSRIPIEGSMLGRVFVSQQPEICPDFATSTDWEAPRLASGGLKCCMDVPLSAGSRRFGVLAQAFATLPPPGEDDLAILCAIANCLASHLLLHEQLVQLGELALTDPLTQLFNRRVFEERVSALWRGLRERGRQFSVAVVDLDHFKAINDTHGHDFGDEVLRSVAETLVATSRPNDTVVRMGGEEFSVLLEDADAVQATAIADRLCSAIGALRFQHRGQEIRVTASIGVAMADENHDSPRLVTMLADKALYSAKRAGRNRVAGPGRETEHAH